MPAASYNSESGSGAVVIASDHGGFAMKSAIKTHLSGRGVRVIDVGTHDKNSCDYPVFARAAALAIASGRARRGIVIDGAGIGSAMAANKVPGVRAGMAYNKATVINAREHNDAHIMTLGAGYLDEATAIEMVDLFLATECTVERHQRRVAMIETLDYPRSASTAPVYVDRNVPVVAPASPPIPPSVQGSSRMPATADYQQLVESISKVLSSNPSLLASLVSANSGVKRPEAVKRIVARAARISATLGVCDQGALPKDVAKLIDHTLLKADTTYAQVDVLCDEARKYGFASVCVNPIHVKRCADKLRGSDVKVCTVIGFPLGATPKQVKALEARQALRDGARELDMVINIGALKSGDHKTVLEDIRLLAEVAHAGRAILKVIIETALLTDDEKVAACVISKTARADFVKTSTGFSTGGATVEDVFLMAQAVDHKLGVKASGGVRSADDAKKMVAAGATRIGASVGVRIVQETQGLAVSGGGGGGY